MAFEVELVFADSPCSGEVLPFGVVVEAVVAAAIQVDCQAAG